MMSLVRAQFGEPSDKVYGPCPLYRGIVQLVEYRSPKPQVLGSNPSAPGKPSLNVNGGFFCLHKKYGKWSRTASHIFLGNMHWKDRNL